MARWVAILSTVKTRPSIRWRVDGGRNVGRRSDRLVDRQETIKPIEEPARGLMNIARFLSSPLFSFLSSFSFSPFRRVGQRLHKSPLFINRHDSREPSLEIWFFTLLLILVKGSHAIKDRVLFPWWINWIDSFRKRVLVASLCIHFFFFLRSILDTQLHAARKTVQISDFLWLVPRWNSVLLPCVFSIRTNSPFFYFFPALKNETANAFLSANDRTTREKKGKRDQKCETFRSDR